MHRRGHRGQTIKILVVRNMHHTNLSRTEFVAVFQTNSDLQGRCRASLHRRRTISKNRCMTIATAVVVALHNPVDVLKQYNNTRYWHWSEIKKKFEIKNLSAYETFKKQNYSQCVCVCCTSGLFTWLRIDRAAWFAVRTRTQRISHRTIIPFLYTRIRVNELSPFTPNTSTK